MIHVVHWRAKTAHLPPAQLINTTSRSKNWSRGLSPMVLGPVELYGGHEAKNVENAWQYGKVYAEHADERGDPTADYFEWAKLGWAKDWADRYPMGRGRKPLCSWWDGKKLGYVEARKAIYCPLYAAAVEKTEAFKTLREIHEAHDNLYLWDFDGYDHRKLDMTWQDVLDCPTRKMGHAFVLAMLLENQRLWETKDGPRIQTTTIV
jgi:hypothetical protein